MFGFSTSYYHALFLRFLTGLLNGVVGVSKTYIAEICDETNQSKAFSLLGLNRALGLLVGPALGGFLSYPSHQWPQLFPLGSLFDKFPYALPTTVGFLIACCGLTCSFFVLEETRIWHIQEEEEVEGEICAPPSPASLPDPSIGVSVGNTSMSTLPDEEMPATLQEEVRECDPAEHTPLLQNDHCSSSYTNSTSSTPVLQPVPDNNNHTTANTSTAAVSSAFETVKRMFLDKSIFYSVFIYNCIQFFFVIYDEAFVLWARMPVNDGGIGWEPDEIGTAFSAAGIVLLFYQLFIYHVSYIP